ncbi:MAG: 2-isopropylmalate synthase [Synergistetes bacterium]|nr:2-isopropylmalate synthase [Synergistota bacterium]
MSAASYRSENWWVSPYNFKEEIRRGWNLPSRIQIHDATLRDGEQIPGVVLRKDEKVRIAAKLSEVGIHRIEGGMPVVSDEDKEAIKEMKRLGLPSKIFGFVRAREEDIMAAADCEVDGIIIEVPISRPKLEYQFGWPIDRAIEVSLRSLSKAKEIGLYTVFFPFDTTRSEEEDLVKLLTELKNANVLPDAIAVVDTMGCALPEGMGYIVSLMKSIVDIPVEVHTHNDFGLAVANSIAALKAGAEVVHCCVNGMGERTGNCSTEEIVTVITLLMGIDIGIDLSKLQELSDLVREATGFPVPPNKPIVGAEIFSRESGIGADMIFKAPLAMFALNPSFLGKRAKLLLGKKSGMTSINFKLKEYGIELEEDKKKMLLEDVKKAGIEKKRTLTDEEFLELVDKYKS